MNWFVCVKSELLVGEYTFVDNLALIFTYKNINIKNAKPNSDEYIYLFAYILNKILCEIKTVRNLYYLNFDFSFCCFTQKLIKLKSKYLL